MESPIHQENGYWWFWDETWADREGPFTTEAEAEEELARYCIYLQSGIKPKKGPG